MSSERDMEKLETLFAGAVRSPTPSHLLLTLSHPPLSVSMMLPSFLIILKSLSINSATIGCLTFIATSVPGEEGLEGRIVALWTCAMEPEATGDWEKEVKTESKQLFPYDEQERFRRRGCDNPALEIPCRGWGRCVFRNSGISHAVPCSVAIPFLVFHPTHLLPARAPLLQGIFDEAATSEASSERVYVDGLELCDERRESQEGYIVPLCRCAPSTLFPAPPPHFFVYLKGCAGALACRVPISSHSLSGNMSALVDAHCPHLMNAGPAWERERTRRG
jgi:hypothetical protein